jgi:hypothetical protein
MDLTADDQLENLYQNYWTFHASMIDQDHDPIKIAAILVAQAMSIYKTVLSPEEYERMIDSISDSRDKVQQLELGLGVLH